MPVRKNNTGRCISYAGYVDSDSCYLFWIFGLFVDKNVKLICEKTSETTVKETKKGT